MAAGSREPCWSQPTLSQGTQLGQAVPAPHTAVMVSSLEPGEAQPRGPASPLLHTRVWFPRLWVRPFPRALVQGGARSRPSPAGSKPVPPWHEDQRASRREPFP